MLHSHAHKHTYIHSAPFLSFFLSLFSTFHTYTCLVAFRATLKRKNTLAHLDLEKEKERQKTLGKKGGLAGSVGGHSANGSSHGPVIGGGISLGSRSPTLSAVSKASLATTKKSPSPSPPLKPPKKLIKSANGKNGGGGGGVKGRDGSNLSLGSVMPNNNNEQRLSALYRYDILDTPPEVSFDGLFLSPPPPAHISFRIPHFFSYSSDFVFVFALIVDLRLLASHSHSIIFRYCKNGFCRMW